MGIQYGYTVWVYSMAHTVSVWVYSVYSLGIQGSGLVLNFSFYLEISNSCSFSLEKSLKHEAWLCLVEKDNFTVGVISGRMEKVFKETIHTVVINVAADNDKLTLRIHLKLLLMEKLSHRLFEHHLICSGILGSVANQLHYFRDKVSKSRNGD